jgi:hypothetical protein
MAVGLFRKPFLTPWVFNGEAQEEPYRRLSAITQIKTYGFKQFKVYRVM